MELYYRTKADVIGAVIYQQVLSSFDNLLSRPDVARPPIRRQIVWTLLRRHDGQWAKLSTREVNRARQLLEENLEEETRDSTSLRLWLRAIRLATARPSLDAVIERVAYWKANTGSLDAAYYLYVLHCLPLRATLPAGDGGFPSGGG